jgi:hypothetical protein
VVVIPALQRMCWNKIYNLHATHCYLLHIYMVYSQCSDKFQHQNKDKSPYQHVFTHLVFKVQSPYSPDLTLSDFYLWRQLKPKRVQVQNEEILYQHTFMLVRPFATAPPLKGCQKSWSDMTMHAFTHVRDFWAFTVKCDLMHNKNSTVIKLIMWVRFSIITNECTS